MKGQMKKILSFLDGIIFTLLKVRFGGPKKKKYTKKESNGLTKKVRKLLDQ